MATITRSMVDRQTGSQAKGEPPLWFLLEGGGHNSNRSLFASIYSTKKDRSVVENQLPVGTV